MKLTEQILRTVVMAAAVVIVAVIVAGKVGIYAEQAKQTARYQAVDSCMAAGSVVTMREEDGRNATTTEPIREVYDQCMTDKGLEVTQAVVLPQPSAEPTPEGK